MKKTKESEERGEKEKNLTNRWFYPQSSLAHLNKCQSLNNCLTIRPGNR